MNNWEVKTEPTSEPIGRDALKSHLRVDHSEDDTGLSSLIESARRELEGATGRAFVTQTRTMRLSCFPYGSESKIYLPGHPVQSITHVKYIDSDGVQQTWSSSEYALRKGSPSWLQLGADYSWPSHRGEEDEIEIEYVCGEAASAVDERVKHAMKLRAQLDYAEQHDKEWERAKFSYDSLVMQLCIGEEFVTYGS